MADDFADDGDRAPGGGPNVAALNAALNGATATTEGAQDFLRKQSQLTDVQTRILEEEHAFEVSHLRWRRFNDQMRGAMQVMLVAAGLLTVVFICAAMWNASQADGIVVETFSVPPSFAANGVGGDVVADDITNKIAAIRDTANGNSFVSSKDVRNDRAEDIKVEIPETGVSLAQAWRYLKSWLGHERPLHGSVRTVGDGKIALTVALEGDNAIAFAGQSSDLDSLEQKAAEHVFASVDPNNYVLYLDAMNRGAEALASVEHWAQSQTDTIPRSGSLSLWSVETRSIAGDVPLAIARARFSLAIYPRMVIAHREILVGEHLLGHDEDALKETAPILAASETDFPPQFRGHGFDQLRAAAAVERDADLGDFADAQLQPCFYCSTTDALLQRAEFAARAHAIADSRTMLAQAAVMANASPLFLLRARYFLDAAAQNWPAAAADAKAYGDAFMTDKTVAERFSTLHLRTLATPLRAEALARSDFASARRDIETTPRNCYHCVRVRGVIEALRGNQGDAAAWFAEAVKQAPSLPFAYLDWGSMLLAKGDYDAAIGKFREANLKGPHFADPLEMWGEALMLENRSDLALAKFEEADKYAPNWGRLHLEWGEALFYAGKRDEAKKQLAIAAALDFSQTDKVSLGRWITGHG